MDPLSHASASGSNARAAPTTPTQSRKSSSDAAVAARSADAADPASRSCMPHGGTFPSMSAGAQCGLHDCSSRGANGGGRARARQAAAGGQQSTGAVGTPKCAVQVKAQVAAVFAAATAATGCCCCYCPAPVPREMARKGPSEAACKLSRDRGRRPTATQAAPPGLIAPAARTLRKEGHVQWLVHACELAAPCRHASPPAAA
jgi:hypothetical protein